jgi:hypothetical protein
VFTSFPPGEPDGTELLLSLSPSLSDAPRAAGADPDGGPGGGFIIMACVMPLLTAPIELMGSPEKRPEGPTLAP